MSVVIEVQALLALERLDEAERAGRRTVERLGDRVPQARGMNPRHRRRGAAAACCERVWRMIREEPWEGVVPGLVVTASVGVASADDAGDLRELTDVADQRLYAAKRAGRDRVVV